MKKFTSLFLIMICFLSGCANRAEIVSYTFEPANRTFLALYEKKVLFINADSHSSLRLFDFEMNEDLLISELPYFFLKGSSNTLVDTTLYFYITELRENKLFNVLYSFDFNTLIFKEVSTNEHSQHLIPLATFNGTVHSLQQNIEGDKQTQFFVLKHFDDVSVEMDLKGKILEYDIISIHSNGDHLYTVEKDSINEGVYFIGKYDSQYQLKSYFNISSLYTDNKLQNTIKAFKVLNDTTFYLSDYNSNAVLFEKAKDETNTIMYGQNLLYAEDYVPHRDVHFFLITGSDIFFTFNTNTHELIKNIFEISSYNKATYFSLAYQNQLLLLKRNQNETESIYLYQNNK